MPVFVYCIATVIHRHAMHRRELPSDPLGWQLFHYRRKSRMLSAVLFRTYSPLFQIFRCAELAQSSVSLSVDVVFSEWALLNLSRRCSWLYERGGRQRLVQSGYTFEVRHQEMFDYCVWPNPLRVCLRWHVSGAASCSRARVCVGMVWVGRVVVNNMTSCCVLS